MKVSMLSLRLTVILWLLAGSAIAQEPDYVDVAASEAARRNYPSVTCPEGLSDCRVRMVPKIVNGNFAVASAFPWVVSIGRSQSDSFGGHLCGGTIIDSRFVLTAAHCFGNLAKPNDFRVQAGTVKLAGYKDKARVKRILIHPLFKRDTLENDVALLEMDQPFTTTESTKAIDLQSQADFDASAHEKLQGDVSYTITGFGATWNGGGSLNQLKFSDEIPSLPTSVCRQLKFWGKLVFDDKLKDEMICAGDTSNASGSDACKGDSGGGLIFIEGSKRLVAGIVSRGALPTGEFDCTEEPLRVGVYTRVSAFAVDIHNCIEGETCKFVALGE